jgi:hypothetical protein
MNKLIFPIIISFCLCFTSCEEPDADLRFEIETLTDKNAVMLKYYSVDPSCMPKSYTLYVDEESSVDITLVCTNYNEPLCFYNTKDDSNIETNGCSASINGSTITIKCYPTTEYGDDAYYTILPICAKNNTNLSTSIAVERCQKSFLTSN